MQVQFVLYVRATETEIVQVVLVSFSRMHLAGHVAVLKPFAIKYFGWAHGLSTTNNIPPAWQTIVTGHHAVWRSLLDPVLHRDKQAVDTIMEACPHYVVTSSQQRHLCDDARRLATALRHWDKLQRAPMWPVKSVKFIAQVSAQLLLLLLLLLCACACVVCWCAGVLVCWCAGVLVCVTHHELRMCVCVQYLYNIFHSGVDIISGYASLLMFLGCRASFHAKLTCRLLAFQVINAFEAYRIYSCRHLLDDDKWKGHASFKAATRRVCGLRKFITLLVHDTNNSIELAYDRMGGNIVSPSPSPLAGPSPGPSATPSGESSSRSQQPTPSARCIPIPRKNKFRFFASEQGTQVRYALHRDVPDRNGLSHTMCAGDAGTQDDQLQRPPYPREGHEEGCARGITQRHFVGHEQEQV
jgi:hypothetical protein